MIRRTLLILAATSAASAHAQMSASGPETVIRSLVRATYANDSKSFEKLTLPESGIGVLTRGGSVNQDGLRELDEDPTGVQIIRKRDFEYRGTAVRPDLTGKYPLGTTAVYVVAHHRSPMVMITRMTADGWKIDPRWWLGMVKLATTDGPAELQPGEFRRLPTGQIAEGSAEADTKVLVGFWAYRNSVCGAEDRYCVASRTSALLSSDRELEGKLCGVF